MATRTLRVAEFGNGSVVVNIDINDANWRVSRVHCSNGSNKSIVFIIKKAGVGVGSFECSANNSQSWNTSGIQLGWQPDYWNTITNQYEPSGIDLLDYSIEARYPA